MLGAVCVFVTLLSLLPGCSGRTAHLPRQCASVLCPSLWLFPHVKLRPHRFPCASSSCLPSSQALRVPGTPPPGSLPRTWVIRCAGNYVIHVGLPHKTICSTRAGTSSPCLPLFQHLTAYPAQSRRRGLGHSPLSVWGRTLDKPPFPTSRDDRAENGVPMGPMICPKSHHGFAAELRNSMSDLAFRWAAAHHWLLLS